MKKQVKNTKIENKVAGRSVYEVITDRVIEQLSKGIVPWQQPWVGGSALAVSYETGRAYSMLNQMLLGKPGEWITWNKIQELGGKVRKGARSGIYVWTKSWEEKQTNEETGEETVEVRRCLKWYRAFHIDDVEGVESKLEPVVANPDLKPIEEAEKVVNGYVEREKAGGFTFHNNRESSSAYYSPSRDEVVVPMISQYAIPEEYYSTTFHELGHSTMKASRCDREADNKVAAFGSHDYSREELVAEMCATFLMNTTGIEVEKTFKNNVAYIQNWLKALKNDTKMVSWAASRAEKAAKYILNLV